MVAVAQTKQAQRTKALREEENEAVRAFVRNIIRDRFDGNQSAAAKKWGVTQPMISDLLSRKRGAGMKLLSAVSTYSGISIDQILGKAPLPELIVELQDRYPNRVEAARFARASGVEEEAVQVVLSYELKSDDDPSPMWWLDQMRAEASRMRFARLAPEKTPEQVVEERRQARPHEDELAALEEERRRKMAERKARMQQGK
jgi:hypothetical protein